jgi:hypothetical protein
VPSCLPRLRGGAASQPFRPALHIRRGPGVKGRARYARSRSDAVGALDAGGAGVRPVREAAGTYGGHRSQPVTASSVMYVTFGESGGFIPSATD